MPRELWRLLRAIWERQAQAPAAGAAAAGASAAAGAAKGGGGAGGGDGDAKPEAGGSTGGGGGGDSDVEVVGEKEGSAAPAAEQQQQPDGQQAQQAAAPPRCAELRVFDAAECEACRAEMQRQLDGHRTAREALEAERVALVGLHSGVGETLEAGREYYLLPSAWFREWRAYMTAAAGRRSSSAAAAAAVAAVAGGGGAGGGGAAAGGGPPPPLLEAVRQVLCRCPEHAAAPLLAVRPPAVAGKRGRYVQDAPDDDALRAIKAADWHALLQFHGGDPSADDADAAAARRGIRARVQVAGGGGGDGAAAATANGGPPPPSQQRQRQSEAIVIDGDAPSPKKALLPGQRPPLPDGPAELATAPALCLETLARAERDAREAMLVNDGAEVRFGAAPTPFGEGWAFENTNTAP